MSKILLAMLILGSISISYASCKCACQNGQKTNICQNATDTKISSCKGACQATDKLLSTGSNASSSANSNSNAPRCQLEQVYNEKSMKYSYENICH